MDLNLSVGSAGGGVHVRAGASSHSGHQRGRAYDAAAFNGSWFEVDELCGPHAGRRKRKRRVLVVTGRDVLSVVPYRKPLGAGVRVSATVGAATDARVATPLYVKTKVPLRSICVVAFKEGHNVSIETRPAPGASAYASAPTFVFYSPAAAEIAGVIAMARVRSPRRGHAGGGGSGGGSGAADGGGGDPALADLDCAAAPSYAAGSYDALQLMQRERRSGMPPVGVGLRALRARATSRVRGLMGIPASRSTGSLGGGTGLWRRARAGGAGGGGGGGGGTLHARRNSDGDQEQQSLLAAAAAAAAQEARDADEVEVELTGRLRD
eukprot:g3603.t1